MDPEYGSGFDPSYAILTFQNDGGGFLKIEDDGSLKLECSPIEDIKPFLFQKECVVPSQQVVILQSLQYSSFCITGYGQRFGNLVNGKPVPGNPNASQWILKRYIELFPLEEKGKDWVVLQWCGSKQNLYFVVKYESGSHQQFLLAGTGEAKDYGAFTLSAPR